MARARNIKPAFFLNDDLVELEFEYRLLFIGLWTLADREGRLEDRPKRIKMGVFPADNVDVETGLGALAHYGFIQRYEVNGEKVVQILNFTKHQNPHHTEKGSELPDINGNYPDNHAKKTVKKQSETVNAQPNNGNSPDNNGVLTVNPPFLDGENPADSLIPDSLIPETLQEIDAAAAASPKPERAKAVKDLDYSEWPAKPSEQIFKDWLTLRKDKKMRVTQTVVDQFADQLKLATAAGYTVDECFAFAIKKGWAGFEYEWMINARAIPANPANRVNKPHTFENQQYQPGVL